MTRRARGATLAELLVAMTLLGIVGSAAAAAMRQQVRIRLTVGSRVTAGLREREAVASLATDLMVASTAGGDIPAAGATDSTLDLQVTVASGFTCSDTAPPRAVTVAAFGAAAARSIAPGDTLRTYTAAPEGWRSAAIQAVVRAADATGCAAAPDAFPVRLIVDSAARAAIAAGAPLHVTRRIRYSFYRAADGGTYLGLREWSHAAGRLATVQPLAGAFDGEAARFTYFDSLGAVLASPAPAGRIAAVGVQLGPTARLRTAGAAPVPMRILGVRNRR